jgi:hypothetical protein
VSSDSRGAQPRLIPADKAALARGKNGRRRSIALQGFRWALSRRVRGDTGGTTFALLAPARYALWAICDGLPRHRPVPRLCRPTLAGRSPAPIQPTRPRWRAGKMGADGASPSRSRAAAVCELANLAQSRGDDLRVPLPRSVQKFCCCFTADLYKGMPCAPLEFYPCSLPWLQAH